MTRPYTHTATDYPAPPHTQPLTTTPPPPLLTFFLVTCLHKSAICPYDYRRWRPVSVWVWPACYFVIYTWLWWHRILPHTRGIDVHSQITTHTCTRTHAHAHTQNRRSFTNKNTHMHTHTHTRIRTHAE
jgi:hypothetical protein